MRLDTAEKRAQYRQIMIPKGATPDPRNSDAGACYLLEYPGNDTHARFVAMAFRGSAGKPEFHYSFRSAEQRECKIVEFFARIASHQEYRAKCRTEAAAAQYDVKVGDIFVASWGYDQTNIDYYQCTALIGTKMMEVREIDSQSEDTAWLQGKSVPMPGAWSTEADSSEAGQKYKDENGRYPRVPKQPMHVKIQGANGEPCFRVASYCLAYRVKPVTVIEGKPIYREHHWTAYA